jgi:hypothetical protein
MFPDGYDTTENQISYMCHELENGKYKDVRDDLQKANDLATAVEIFQDRYEKCDPAHCNFASRDKWAETYLGKYSKVDS